MLCVINNEVNITFEDCYYYLRSIFPCEIFSIETEYFSKPNHATNLSWLSYCMAVCFILVLFYGSKLVFDASNKSFEFDEYIIVAQFPYFLLYKWNWFIHTKFANLWWFCKRRSTLENIKIIVYQYQNLGLEMTYFVGINSAHSSSIHVPLIIDSYISRYWISLIARSSNFCGLSIISMTKKVLWYLKV